MLKFVCCLEIIWETLKFIFKTQFAMIDSYDMFANFILQSYFPFKTCSIASIFLCHVVGHIKLLRLKPQSRRYLNIAEDDLSTIPIIPLFKIYYLK